MALSVSLHELFRFFDPVTDEQIHEFLSNLIFEKLAQILRINIEEITQVIQRQIRIVVVLFDVFANLQNMRSMFTRTL